MKTRHHLLVSVICLLSVFQAVAGTHTTKIESFFFVTPEIYAREHVNPFDIFVIPAGTEVELLTRVNYYYKADFVKVRLADGSLGFMPSSAFADATLTLNEAGVTLMIGGSSLPEGTYRVMIKSPWKYSPENVSGNHYRTQGVSGGRLSLKSKNGKTYLLEEDQTYSEVRVSDKGNTYTAYKQSPIHEVFNYGDFQEVLDSLPKGDGVTVRFVPVFNASDHDLNSFAGCSRSYLETLFGEPYAYVGPELSQLSGYTFAVYKNVGWKRGKGERQGGILVVYDKNLCARLLITKPIGYASGADDAPLLFPKHPLAEPEQGLLSAFEKETFTYVPMRKEWEPLTEVYSKPKGMDGIRIALPLFFERSLGIKNPFAIWGLLLLLELLLAGFVIVWIRYFCNYGSNGWASARCFLLMIPMVVLIVAYLWRYPLLFTIFGGIIALGLASIPSFRLGDEISYKRCPKCHQYCEPIILQTHEGKFHGDNYTPTAYFEPMDVIQNNGEYGAFNDVRYTKYKTTMRVSQDMQYDVRCPECGHKWTQKKVESRPTIPGPILIVEEHDARIATPYKKTTTNTLLDGHGNKLDETEEVEHGVDYDRDKYKINYYDYDGFFPYFNAFINGDNKAIDRYYKRRWDSITWQEVRSSNLKNS